MPNVLTPGSPDFQPLPLVPISISLRTACSSYYAIRKAGQRWAVQIVTPCGVEPLRTTVATFVDGDGAIAYAEKVAAEMRRPFHMGEAL
jgi:hypothetical protein